MLPEVSKAIAKHEGYHNNDLDTFLDRLSDKVFDTVKYPEKIEKVVVRYCKRRIDRILKTIDFSDGSTVDELKQEYIKETQALEIETVAKKITDQIRQTIDEKNLPKLLSCYDNKGLMALAASQLKNSKKNDFENWLTRILRNNRAPEVSKAIFSELPKLPSPNNPE